MGVGYYSRRYSTSFGVAACQRDVPPKVAACQYRSRLPTVYASVLLLKNAQHALIKPPVHSEWCAFLAGAVKLCTFMTQDSHADRPLTTSQPKNTPNRRPFDFFSVYILSLCLVCPCCLVSSLCFMCVSCLIRLLYFVLFHPFVLFCCRLFFRVAVQTRKRDSPGLSFWGVRVEYHRGRPAQWPRQRHRALASVGLHLARNE